MAEVTHVIEDQKIVTGSLVTNANGGDTLTLKRFTTWGAAGIQLAGTWTGTVTFEVTCDGTNWQTISMTPSNSATPATSATANGIWYIANCFFAGIRARCTAAMTGSVSATVLGRPSQF